MEDKEKIIEQERKELAEKYLEDLTISNYDDCEKKVILEAVLKEELGLNSTQDEVRIAKCFWRGNFRLGMKTRGR